MTLVVAHRGLGFGEPEHSLEGYRAALEAGVDGIEVDIRLTRDGQLVCLHDESLYRTTGLNFRACDLNHRQLADLGVVPLWKVLALLKDFGGGKGILIETKHPVVSGSLVERRLADDLTFFGLSGKAPKFARDEDVFDEQAPWSVVMSFSLLAVRKIQSLLPEQSTVLLLSQLWSLGIAFHLLESDVGVGPNIALVGRRPEFLPRMVDQRRATFIWTVNSLAGLKTCMSEGATCVITDDASLALHVRAEVSSV